MPSIMCQKRAYNRIDVARIVFFCVCAILLLIIIFNCSNSEMNNWIIIKIPGRTWLSKLWPTWIKDKTYPSKCMKLKSVKPLFTLLKSVEHLFVSPLPGHDMQMSPGHLHTVLIFSKKYIWRNCNVIIISKRWTLRCCFDVMSGDLISASLEFIVTVFV